MKGIHYINPACSSKVPTSSSFSSNHQEMKEPGKQPIFTIRDQSWNYTHECLCVSIGEKREGRVDFTACSCSFLPFNKLLVLIPSEIN